METLTIPGLQHYILFHYSEIGLKSGNRRMFEDQLMRNIRAVLKDMLKGPVRRSYGRAYFELPDSFDWDIIADRLSGVVGLANFSLAVAAEQDMEQITDVARRLMQQLSFASFSVRTRRSEKRFPITSEGVNRLVGSLIQQDSGARVDLSNPEATCHIELFNNRAAVYVAMQPGLRGLPVGTGGKAVSLISSGIDSPVASWKIISRGVRLTYVHFHSAPFTSEASIINTKRLVQILTRYQLTAKLYSVPFIDIQQHVKLSARPNYLVVIYRRSMLRIARMIARRERANALVTGESIGQVASQTLANMRVINEAARLPVLRPLSGSDKEEIMQLARRIGTFDISTEPYDDCCSLFVPQHPVTRAKPALVLGMEEELDLVEHERRALRAAEITKYTFP